MNRVNTILLCLLVALYSKAQLPTIAASNLSVNQISCSEATLSWTSGNGSARIVIASESASLSSLPTQNVYYLATDSFGNGSSLGANEYVVYNGFRNTVTVKKLKPNTTYYFSVFEYNGSGLVFDYMVSNYPEQSDKTETLSVDFTLSDDYQCELGNSTDFIPTVTQSNPQTLSYSWDFGDMTTSNNMNPTKSYSNYGIYKVNLIVSSPGCKASVYKYDTIAPAPIVDFDLDPSVSDNTVVQCFQKPDGSANHFYFENNSTFRYLSTPSSNTVFKWFYGDGTFDNQIINGDVSYTKPGVYTVKLVISNSFTPRDELCKDSLDLIVEVRQKPIDTSLLQLDSVMCLNGNLFEFEHNTTDLTATHKWDFGDGNTASSAKTSHSYADVGNYELTLEVTDDNGCYGVYKDKVAVVAQPDNSFSGLKSTYCLGEDSSSLLPLLPGGIWFGSQVTPSGVFTPSQLGKQEISYAIDDNGCKDTFSQSTTVFDIPVFNLGQDTAICQNSSFIKRINRGSTTLSWSTGDTDSFTTIDKAGVLWAEKTENGCSFRDSMFVSVIAPPFFELGGDSLLCGDGVKNIDVTAQDATYTWNDGYVGSTRTIINSGYYAVEVTNICGTWKDDITLTFLPFACEIFIPNAFSPNRDGLNDIFKPSGNVTLISMSVYNRWGELLYKNSDQSFGWNGMANDDKAQEGYYFYIIQYSKPVDGIETSFTAKGEVYLLR